MHRTASGRSDQQFAAASSIRTSTNGRTAEAIWLGTSAREPGRHG
ncbi:hypothetical protein OHA44_13360 [Streptomyces sp. NBC_00144]